MLDCESDSDSTDNADAVHGGMQMQTEKCISIPMELSENFDGVDVISNVGSFLGEFEVADDLVMNFEAVFGETEVSAKLLEMAQLSNADKKNSQDSQIEEYPNSVTIGDVVAGTEDAPVACSSENIYTEAKKRIYACPDLRRHGEHLWSGLDLMLLDRDTKDALATRFHVELGRQDGNIPHKLGHHSGKNTSSVRVVYCRGGARPTYDNPLGREKKNISKKCQCKAACTVFFKTGTI